MFGTGSTYGGHPVSCAVAIETLNICRDNNIIDHVHDVSKVFMQRLSALGDVAALLLRLIEFSFSRLRGTIQDERLATYFRR